MKRRNFVKAAVALPVIGIAGKVLANDELTKVSFDGKEFYAGKVVAFSGFNEQNHKGSLEVTNDWAKMRKVNSDGKYFNKPFQLLADDVAAFKRIRFEVDYNDDFSKDDYRADENWHAYV